jgi:hypothetical protein
MLEMNSEEDAGNGTGGQRGHSVSSYPVRIVADHREHVHVRIDSVIG